MGQKHWTARNGVWVETDQGVGIVIHEKATFRPDGRPDKPGGPWIHLTSEDGTTLAQIPAVRCSNVRQARAASIPKARIEHLSEAQLAALGYV